MAPKLFAAAAGAVAFQAIAGLFASPARAAWGWHLSVPAGLGFSCSEGTSIGCDGPCPDENFTCTVVPDTGFTCDVSSTNVVCSIPAESSSFVPDSANPMCINVESFPTYNNATLSWSPVPSCTNSSQMSGAGCTVAGLASATVAAAQLL